MTLPPSGPERARPSLTPPAFASALAQPEGAGVPPVPSPGTLQHHVPAEATLSRRGRSASPWLIGLLVVVLVAVVGYFLDVIGPAASVIGGVVALVPLAIVFIGVRIIDRWEPEPVPLVLLAVGWGAIVAVGAALGVDALVSLAVGAGDSSGRQLFAALVQAPIVEEAAKGLGILLIFATAARAFDGPVDGVVYGMLVGGGFAFTENIQYFAVALLDGGAADLGATFFVRGILSPFAHAMFSALTGFALGLAARRGSRGGAAVAAWAWGLLGAIALHAVWNASAVLFDFFPLYVVVQVPLFVLFVLGILALRREEARLTRQRLGEYADAGWFTPQEVEMLATGAGRRRGLAWAATLRGDRTALMRRFIHDATALAAARQRAHTGRDPRAAAEEATLLQRTAQAREGLFAL